MNPIWYAPDGRHWEDQLRRKRRRLVNKSGEFFKRTPIYRIISLQYSTTKMNSVLKEFLINQLKD